MATTTMERAPAAAVLREFLLSVERTQQRIDSAVQLFAAHEDARLLRALLDVHPTAEPLLRIWPDGSAAARWENRDSMVAFLDVMTRVLRAQTAAAPESAAALAGKLVREKHASLEKMLTWNDKPALVCGVLELLRAVVDVSAAVARDFVRLFNLQSAPFVALASRRMKKPTTDSGDKDDDDDDDDDDKKKKKKKKQQQKQNKAATEDARVPQVRAAYVRLVDALASCPDKSVHRFALKDGGLVASLWKGIDGDDAEMLATVLARMKALVLENDAVDLRGRAAIFNAGAVQQLMAVLKSDDDATAELAFDMLRTLFLAENALHRVPSRRSLRAFLTKAPTAGSSNTNNDSSNADTDAATGAEAAAAAASVRLIRTAVTSVGANEFIRHEFARRLALELVRAYPGVLAEYLGVLAPQLEPKPGYRWFSVANMVHRLLSSGLDAAVDDIRQDATPSLSSSALVSRVICPLAWRKELTRCLQHTSDLVVYTALGLVEASLQRYQALAPWLSALSEIQDELRFLLPSPEVLVSLLLRLSSHVHDKGLVYIRALAVARLYLECLPDAMSEVKADVAKLVPWDALDARAQTPLQHAIAGEILRFLAVVDDSRLSSLLSVDGRQQRSKLLQLLLLFVSSSSDTIRCLAKSVLMRLLAALKVFGNTEHQNADDASNLEILMWLDELRFSGERCAVFLDAIVQELVNNPFAFVADLHSRVPANAASADARRSVSPALLALVSVLHDKEQDDLWKNSAATMDACRNDPTVLEFAARVVLAAIVRSRHPEILARLVVPDADADADESRSRKRRRTDPPATYNSSPLSFLTLVCQRILSSSALPRQLEKTSKKTANVAAVDLLEMAPESLGAALATLSPSAFVASLRQIDETTDVPDAVSSLLARYIGMHPELQLSSEFLSLVVATKKKKKKTTTTTARPLWLEALPCRVFGRHLLFLLSGEFGEAQASRPLELLEEISQSIAHASADDIAALARSLVLCLRLMNVQSEETQTLSKHTVAVLMTALASLLSHCESSQARATISFIADSLDDLVRVNAQCGRTIVAGFLTTTALLRRTALSPSPSRRTRRVFVSGWRVLALTCLADSTAPTLQSRQLCKLLRGSGAVNATLTRHLVVSIDAAALSCPRDAGARLLAVVRSAPSADTDVQFFSAALSVIGRCGGFPSRQPTDDWSALVTSACVNGVSAASVEDVRVLLRRLFALTVDARDDSGAAWGAGLLERCVTSLKPKHSDVLLVLLVASLPLVDFASLPPFVRDVLEQLLYERLCTLFRDDSKVDRATQALVLCGVRQLATDARFGSLRRTVNDIVAAQQSTGVAFTTARSLALSLLVRGSSPTSDLNAAAVLEFLVRSAVKTFEQPQLDDDSLRCIALVVDDLVRAHRPLTLTKRLTQELHKSLETLSTTATDVASVAEFVQLIRLSGILLRLIESSTSPSSFDCDALRLKITTSQWFSVALATPDADTNADVALLEVVAALLRLTSAHDRDLFMQLLGAYNMSLSRRDRMIRALLKRFESAASLSPAVVGYRFGSALASTSLQDAGGHLIQDATWLVDGGLDASRMRATIEFFPLDRDVDDAADHELLLLSSCNAAACSDSDAQVYDPAFLLPLLSHYVSASSISDAVLAQQGVIGVALRAASSNALSVREYAFALLAHVHELFSSESSEFKPARQVHLLLDALRHALAEPLEPVSSVLTVFLNDAVSILCRPAHSMYAALNHFLLARPALDLNDVPMFYALFNSRTPQLYKQERAWLLHTLRRGVREDADVTLLIRRHVPTILLSFFTSELADEHTRLLVGSVLRLMLQTSTGCAYLVTKCGFLDWCAAQLNKAASLQSTAITRLLVQLMDDTLTSDVWNEMDNEQQRSFGAGAINCFWALRRAIDSSSERHVIDADTHTRVLHISELVATRAATASCCSLETLAELFASVASSVSTTITIACATAALSESELLRRSDFQKHRFPEWARVIARVIKTLESCSSAVSMADRERLHVARTRVSSVLRMAPSLRDHVLSELARQDMDWCPLLA
ncbi:hypothetical protein PINS_up001979 [Pythium insidiosum]|nr:hypothetical protein PINS_up001979 [Pythium insidiosum]